MQKNKKIKKFLIPGLITLSCGIIYKIRFYKKMSRNGAEVDSELIWGTDSIWYFITSNSLLIIGIVYLLIAIFLKFFSNSNKE